MGSVQCNSGIHTCVNHLFAGVHALSTLCTAVATAERLCTMALQRNALQCVGRMARQALSAAEEQSGSAFGQQLRQMATESRYSPRIFSREKPVDPSAMWVGKSPYIEALYWRRDHLEREFSWNRRNTFELAYFIGGITALFYGLSLFGIRSADRQSGYPQRNFLGHPSGNGFVNPDEREFY